MKKSNGRHREKVLTDRAVRCAAPGWHLDGAGLYLEVDATGARRWVLRTVVHGRRRDIGLGGYSSVTLAQAREEAATLRKVARAGNDPLATRRAHKMVPTFEAAAKQCFEERADSWRNEKHKAQWLSSLETYAFPIIGSTKVDDIDTPELLNVLNPIWLAIPETARRVRQRVGLVLDWAKAKGFRKSASPTKEIGRALPRQTAKTEHHRALPYTQVPQFLQDHRATGATDAAKDAMEIAVLNALRTSEVLLASWHEIDLQGASWTIPGSRMKTSQSFTIPLTPRSLEILKARKAAHSGHGNYVFEGKPGHPLSNMTLLQSLRRMKIPAVTHGFRSSFRMWSAEKTNTPREVVEACLSHKIESKVERAYQRSDLLEKRRKHMTLWASYCACGAKIVQLKQALGSDQ
jgi:integrase